MNIKNIEKKLWDSANQLRGNMSAEEYMHIILGILSLKYVSDKFNVALVKLQDDGFDLEEVSSSLFYSNYEAFKIADNAHWNHVMKFASTDEIGQKMDEAFIQLEKDNPMLKGIFNKNYNNEGIDQNRLGEVVKIFSDEDFTNASEDIIGRIYEYFLGNFFKDRGQKGGEFYTPTSIVKLMVNLIKPLKGSIYDPACGTGGILVQSKRYIESHGGDVANVTVYGQEFNNVTWKLAKLNLILNGFPLEDNEGNGVLGQKSADTFTQDQHKYSKFDYIMANPPFNLKSWGREELVDDPRWMFGLPPKGNANYAWLSHMLSKLSTNGKAAVVLANGSLSSAGKEELSIRKKLIASNKVDAIIMLPDKLFYTVGIPACIWIFNNNKETTNTLMIDASKNKGNMISKKLRELTDEDIDSMNSVFESHSKNEKIDFKGFAKSVNLEEFEENDYSFVPSRYVGFVEEIIDKEDVKKQISAAANELFTLMDEMKSLEEETKKAIKKVV